MLSFIDKKPASKGSLTYTQPDVDPTPSRSSLLYDSQPTKNGAAGRKPNTVLYSLPEGANSGPVEKVVRGTNAVVVDSKRNSKEEIAEQTD